MSTEWPVEGSSVGAPWPSGVGGVMCGECYRITVCREFGVGQEEDGDSEWLCRPCYLGDDGSDPSQTSTGVDDLPADRAASPSAQQGTDAGGAS